VMARIVMPRRRSVSAAASVERCAGGGTLLNFGAVIVVAQQFDLSHMSVSDYHHPASGAPESRFRGTIAGYLRASAGCLGLIDIHGNHHDFVEDGPGSRKSNANRP
jgi:hypothetical protein